MRTQPLKFLGSMTRDEKSLLLIGGLIPILLILVLIARYRPAESIPLRPWSVCFLPDGNGIATVGGTSNPNELPRRGELVLWDLAKNSERFVLKQRSSVRSVACAPNGQFLAICDFNGSVKLVNPADGKIITTLPFHSDLANSVVVSANSQLVASGGFDGNIQLWNPASRHLEVLSLPGERILNVAISPGAQALVATTRKGKAFLFDLIGKGLPKQLEASSPPVSGNANAETASFAPDGKAFATGCGKSLRLWESPAGVLLREFTNTASITSVVFSPDGGSLLAVSTDGKLAVWAVESGERLQAIQVHDGVSYCAAFSSDGERLATVGRDDFQAKVWDARTFKLLNQVERVTSLRRAR
jgi:WD40 repeat protein